MFKVPVYSFDNYQQIIEASYTEQDTSKWINFSHYLKLLTDDFLIKYRTLDARQLGPYLQQHSSTDKIQFADQEYLSDDIVVAIKLLMPTLRASNYFLRNIEQGPHCGIDIILPKGTPIINLAEGKVIRIKTRDGQKKDEGNCIVIQSGNLYFSYSHLDEIQVDYEQEIARSKQIGTCGKTGASTQYHLHLQIDSTDANFHPYRSNQTANVVKNTINPIQILKDIQNKSLLFKDIPTKEPYYQAIIALAKRGIIKGYQSQIFPNESFPRRQVALVMNRLSEKYKLYSQLPIINHQFTAYLDTEHIDDELPQALINLQKYGIMVGYQSNFNAKKDLKGEERLAVLGRLFFHIKDSTEGIRYDPYVLYFQHKKIIDTNRQFIGKEITRKEVFLILYKLLKFKKII